MSPAERPAELPSDALLVPLREEVILPAAIGAVHVDQPRVIRALDALDDEGYPVVFVPLRDPAGSPLARTNLHDVGCLGRVVRALSYPDGSVRLLAEGIERVRLGGQVRRAGAPRVPVEQHDLPSPADGHLDTLAQATLEAFQGYFALVANLPADLEQFIPGTDDPLRLADYVAANLGLERDEMVEFLALEDVAERMRSALDMVTQRREVAQLHGDVQARVQSAMDRHQREYFLKEQLKVIRTELGELGSIEGEADVLRGRVAKAGMPAAVREEADRELERMTRMHPDAGEYGVARSYLDWLLAMPWRKVTRDRLDLVRAEAILDKDHCGLDRVKERVAEYLAVRQLKSDMKGPILCFIGPPGVGKTSLGRSIARALGRRFERISLGGVKDESEIRGHRRTYVGSMPGRIIQSIRRAGTRNPVIMLDEIDKVGTDFRGDPASALLEALDPEQNHAFVDHYLDVPFDLSQVMFLLTANVSETIPSALHDRLEIIEIPGYTEEEKLDIARSHLIPKQIKGHGLKRSQIRFSEDALAETIRGYTMEAGVRNLEREIARCCRKAARAIVRRECKRLSVGQGNLIDLLGPRRFYLDIAERMDLPGVAVGLAWTPSGGEILFIEATRMDGGKRFRVTGQLGDVMKESAEAALSYIRSNTERLGIDPGFWRTSDLHVHVPAGAIPKDGPSAGIPLTIALVSLLAARKVHDDLAMTGEITLRGKVLPVGGIKEKVLAARRAGIRRVVLPAANEKDLLDIPEPLRNSMEYSFVERIEQVVDLALA